SRTGRGPREEGPRARPELALRARHPPAADRIRPADRGAVGATRVGWDVSYPVWHGGCFTPPHGTLADSPIPRIAARAARSLPRGARLHRPSAPVDRRARGATQRAHLHRARPGDAGTGGGDPRLGADAHRRWTHAARLRQLRGTLARPRARPGHGRRAGAGAGGRLAGGAGARPITPGAVGMLAL